jgi:hypothetical protein
MKNNYRLLYYERNAGRSINSNKLGLTPRKATYKKHLVNTETGEYFVDTDLDAKKRKRNKMLKKFKVTYAYPFKKQQISILSFVIDEKDYETPSKFLNNLNKRLKKLNIQRYGYVWVRDVGEKRAVPHYHILVATSRISPADFKKLCTTRGAKFEVQFAETKTGLTAYLMEKEIYGKDNQKTFGCSEYNIKPKFKQNKSQNAKNPFKFFKSTLIDSIQQEIKALQFKPIFQKEKSRSYAKSKQFKPPI